MCMMTEVLLGHRTMEVKLRHVDNIVVSMCAAR